MKKTKQKLFLKYNDTLIKIPQFLVGNRDVTKEVIRTIKNPARAWVALILINYNQLRKDFKSNVKEYNKLLLEHNKLIRISENNNIIREKFLQELSDLREFKNKIETKISKDVKPVETTSPEENNITKAVIKDEEE